MLGLLVTGAALILGSFTGNVSWYYRLWGLCFGGFMRLIFVYSRTLGGSGFRGFLMRDGLRSSLVVLSWWISLLMLIASQGSVKSGLNKFSLFRGCVCALNFILMVSFFCVDIV